MVAEYVKYLETTEIARSTVQRTQLPASPSPLLYTSVIRVRGQTREQVQTTGG